MFDLSPLYRSTIGYDRLARMLDEVSGFEAPAYPPYNIERMGEDEYRITMAVAGFAREELAIEVNGNSLLISGRKTEKTDEAKGQFLHQGIAARAFERRFQLADHVEVRGAELEHGLLHVVLKREVPESMKPRQIGIKAADASQPKVIDQKAA